MSLYRIAPLPGARKYLRFVVAFTFLASIAHLAAATCPPRWVPAFGGEDGGVSGGGIFSMLTWDDGSGPAIYAAGNFTEAGGEPIQFVARWDGEEWSALGAGLSGDGLISPSVLALAVFNDGTGEALYAAGRFTHSGETEVANIAKWTGTAWVPLGPGLNNSVHALAVFDDGTGPALYAGGFFSTDVGGVANRVARWNGTTWTNLEGVTPIQTLQVYDDGTGPALYAGGVGSAQNPGNRLTRWTGEGWEPLEETLSGTPAAMIVFDSGDGPELVAAGSFTTAGGVTVNNIARWNGERWAALAEGFTLGTDQLHTLAIYDDGMGSGPSLFAGGNFNSGDPVRRKNIARWDGERWWALHAGAGVGASSVRSMTVFDDGSGPALFVGGGFTEAGLIEANNIAKWQGCDYQPLCEPQWAALGGGVTVGTNVQAIGSFDAGNGPVLFISGPFTEIDGIEVSNSAKWDGVQWSHSGLQWQVYDFVVFDDGTGPALYAGGDLFVNNDFTQTFVMKWDGADWSPYGSGLGRKSGGFQGRSVTSLAVFDDGSGPALYAGGDFTTAGGEEISMVAKWNGEEWVALGGGLYDPGTFHRVNSMIVHDDGSGPALYVAGNLPGIVDLDETEHIARWDGQQWSSLGGRTAVGNFITLEVFDDGDGPALFAGGSFGSTIGMDNSENIVKWDGEKWVRITPQIQSTVTTMAVFDDGTGGGPALFLGGGFRSVDYKETGEIAKWDGVNWWGIRDGVERVGALNSINAMHVFDDNRGNGPLLYVGGRFVTAGKGVEVNRIAKYGCIQPPPTGVHSSIYLMYE